MSVALLQIKWTVHDRDDKEMISPNIESSGNHMIELRGETTTDCVKRINEVMQSLQRMMMEDGVEIHEEDSVVQSPKVRGMR